MVQAVIIKRVTALLLCVFLAVALWAGDSCAADAAVLPKGVFGTSIQGEFYFPMTKRFDPDGNTEEIAGDFNTSLDSTVFPVLADLEAAFGMPAGSATLGDSEVDFKFGGAIYKVLVGYGLTDKLTVGVKVPYWRIRNKVKARVDSSTATIGQNPLFGTDQDPFGSPLIPVAAGGVPLTTDDVQNLLGDGLPGIPGFGFERVEDWSEQGFGDVEAGVKYQYLKTDTWQLAFTGALRLPTGEIDDPDNLQDFSFGKNAYALLFRFHNDFVRMENLLIDLTLYYDLVLPDRRTKRVPDNVNNPITRNREKVKINQGDVFSIEPTIQYTLAKLWTPSATYQYSRKITKDKVSGSKGFNYTTLEDETDWTEQTYKVGVSFSTLPLYMEKKFKLPLIASISYWNRFAGTNNVFKSDYLGLDLTLFF